jgi:hypothetical protein
MFAPNLSTHQLADSIHHERQSHSTRILKVQQERMDSANVDRSVQRRITARRLAASLTAVVLTFAIAAIAAAGQF